MTLRWQHNNQDYWHNFKLNSNTIWDRRQGQESWPLCADTARTLSRWEASGSRESHSSFRCSFPLETSSRLNHWRESAEAQKFWSETSHETSSLHTTSSQWLQGSKEFSALAGMNMIGELCILHACDMLLYDREGWGWPERTLRLCMQCTEMNEVLEKQWMQTPPHEYRIPIAFCRWMHMGFISWDTQHWFLNTEYQYWAS